MKMRKYKSNEKRIKQIRIKQLREKLSLSTKRVYTYKGILLVSLIWGIVFGIGSLSVWSDRRTFIRDFTPEC